MPNKRLKIGLYNAGSLGTNHDNIIVSVTRNDIDILAVNETWLRTGEEDRAPALPGYRLRHVPRPRGVRARGGGVGFYIKSSVSVRTWPHPVDPLHASVEQMWLTMTLNGKKLAICTAYRPPWMDVDLFLDAITYSISSIPNYDNVVLLGDFNINLLCNTDIKTIKLTTFLTCHNLSQLVKQPTHFTDSSQTLIDVVCTDLIVRHMTIEHVGSLLGHCLVVSQFNIKREKSLPRTITYRPIKDICKERFSNDLQAIEWNLIDDTMLNDVNDMVNSFNQSVVLLFDAHAPVKTVVIRDRSYPWITDTIKHMMKLRDKASAVYHKTKSDGKKEYYKSLKSTVSQALFHEKVAYFKQNISSKLNEPKQLWKNLKNTLLPPKIKDLPSCFDDPNIINKHFLNIPGAAGVSISIITFFEYHRFNDAVFHIEPISLDSLVKIIASLKSNAEGCDGITLDMLLLTFPYTIDALKDMINASISTCAYPEAWKVAIVRPLPKILNPLELKDLRPISILPCLSKIMEKAVCSQLTKYLEENNILPEVQSGFRKGRSTMTALLDVTDYILCSQDKGLCTLLVLLDFSRAFDSINIDLLMSKLKFYGFDSQSLQWFNSYLSNRYQYVKLNRTDGSSLESDIVSVNRGVPQGSILGPILFILYSADIQMHIKHAKFHIYADDIQVYISCKPSEIDSAITKLNIDLKSIAAWAANNCLLLNPNKTKYLTFGSKHHLANLIPSVGVTLLGEPIEMVYEARNLGLLMDYDLRFEKHIANSVQNCFYKLRVLYKMRPYLTETLRILLVESLVLSKLNYMDTVFGPRLLKRTQKIIQRLQNACTRFCFNVPSRAHVTPFLNQHGILKMKHRRKLHLACLLFGVIRHESPSYLYNKLTWTSSQRSCQSRQRAVQLSTQRHSSATFRGSFRYAASKCWNNIPPPIRNLKSINGFRIQLKKYLNEHQKQKETLKHDISAI